MRRAPRSLEEWLYYTLMDSPAFHRFVRRVHDKINGINPGSDPSLNAASRSASSFLYRPTRWQKFRAYRMLFWDEWRSTLGLPRKTDKLLK